MMTPDTPALDAIANATHLQGAKIALILGQDLIAYLRDDKPDIPDPNRWDLPGGVREAAETAWTCAQRETHEEFGIRVPREALRHAAIYRALADGGLPDRDVAFFVADLSEALAAQIVFADEGQCWLRMPIAEFIARDDAVPGLRHSLGLWLARSGQVD